MTGTRYHVIFVNFDVYVRLGNEKKNELFFCISLDFL